MAYLCSSTYRPGHEHGVTPLDLELGIEWPAGTPLLSGKDAEAPTLREAAASGLLPEYEACRSYIDAHRRI